jgi:hypothetical protein
MLFAAILSACYSMMRLINAQTVKLEEFFDEPRPSYAILSHTWDAEEITFSDLAEPQQAKTKQGFSKIQQVCELTQRHGLGFVWVDTCCIDKSSSTELSHAINSMFRWYEDASICYVYLSDLNDNIRGSGATSSTLSWESCRWFTRGWTLQELLAPSKLEFYDHAWDFLGERNSRPILQALSSITSIDEHILADSRRIHEVSIGTRMSWAANRATSRIEDTAYCLMGIFNVFMPLLYGEGRRAFKRLQEEMLKNSTDMSILAWVSCKREDFRGMLAESPDEFLVFRNPRIPRSPFRCNYDIDITNQGLRMDTVLLQTKTGSQILELTGAEPNLSGSRLGIWIDCVAGSFVRTRPQALVVVEGWVTRERKTIYAKTVYDTNALNSSPVALPGMPVRNRMQRCQVYRQRRNDLTGAPNTYDVVPLSEPNDVRCSSDWFTHAEPIPPELDEEYNDGACDVNNMEEVPILSQDHPFLKVQDSLVESALQKFRYWVANAGHSRHSSLRVSNNAHMFDLDELWTGQQTMIKHDNSLFEFGQEHRRSKFTGPKLGLRRRSLLSCPFYKKDKLEYVDCLKRFELRSIQEVMQHLLNHHGQPSYCPVCYTKFGQVSSRDDHILARSCDPAPIRHVEGISGEHKQQLMEAVTGNMAEEHQWFQMWSVVFPAERVPLTAYNSNPLEELIRIIRDYWRRYGRGIVGGFLSSNGLLNWSLRNEERDLSAMHSIVLFEIMHRQIHDPTNLLLLDYTF